MNTIVDLRKALSTADGLVHATPTGMTAHLGLPLDEDLLDERLWVAGGYRSYGAVNSPVRMAAHRRARLRNFR